jgi:hypothetical protein
MTIDPEYVENLEQQVISLQIGIDVYQDVLGVISRYLEGFKIFDKLSGETFQINEAPLKLEGDLRRFEILADNVIPYDFRF